MDWKVIISAVSLLWTVAVTVGALIYARGQQDTQVAAELQGLVPAVERLGVEFAEHLAERKLNDLTVQKRLTRAQAVACEANGTPMETCFSP